MERTFIEYNLHLEKDNQLDLLEGGDITLEDRIHQFIVEDNSSARQFIGNNKSYIFEIEDITHEYLFGSFGKLDTPGGKTLTRGRDRENYDLKNLEHLIESYTYFYLDISSKKIITLYNSKCTGFKSAFSNFLYYHFRLSNCYRTIKVINQKTENIPETIRKSTKIGKITYSYKTNQVPEGEYMNFKQPIDIDPDHIKSASVSLYFEPNANQEDFIDKLANIFSKKTTFNTFKLDTDQAMIDVIEQTLAKKVQIDISEDEIDNLDKIKELLREQLD